MTQEFGRGIFAKMTKVIVTVFDAHYCPFSRHAVAYRGTTCGKTFHSIFHGIPRNLPRISTVHHETLTLPLTLTLP